MTMRQDCDVCGGLGVVTRNVPINHPDFGKTFSCPNCTIHEEQRQETIIRMSHLDAHQDKVFETFQTHLFFLTENENHTLELAKRAALNYATDLTGWLILRGDTGTGKTHLAAAIAHACVAQGVATIFATVPDLLDNLRAAYAPQSEISYDQKFDQMANVRLLVLDDLGAESPTPWAQEKLYQLIDHRYNKHLPTIVTTNISPSMMSERIASRLEDAAHSKIIHMKVPDFRREGVPVLDEEIAELTNLSTYQQKTFDTFDTQRPGNIDLEHILRRASRYAEAPQGWMLITGEIGSGKTHLAAAIANAWSAQQPSPALIISALDLLDYLQAAFSPETKTNLNRRFSAIRKTPLLVLEDFQIPVRSSSWSMDKLFQLVDYRYLRHLPTIFTMTDAQIKHLKATFPQFHSRIFDLEVLEVLPLGTLDHRQYRNDLLSK